MANQNSHIPEMNAEIQNLQDYTDAIQLIKTMLETGLQAKKYHYNIKSSKECTLKFSSNFQTCFWQYDD